jgi:hypothetical protein
LTQAFASIPRLQPLPARELQTVLSTRHNLSGLKVVFPSTFWTRLAKRLFRRSSQATFIRSLAAVGHGNLRRAMQLWLAHADVEGHVVTLRPIHGFAWGLPFARQLPPAVKALLATLLRHGAVAESVLAHWVGMSRKDTHQLLRFLVASGLVEFVSTCDRYAVRVAAQDDLTSALASDGILPEVGR